MRVRLAGWLLIAYCVVVAGTRAEGADGGTVIAGWGLFTGSSQFNFPSGLTNVLAISAGDTHGIALMPNRTVRAWGFDNYGVTDVPASLTNVVAIAAGANHNLALTTKGKVVQWGLNTPKKLALRNVVAIAAGNDFSLALQRGGTIKAWGSNSYVIVPPRRLKNVTAIAAGDSHALVLKKDGTVVSWGRNNFGQTNVPAGLSNVVMIAAGYNSSAALDARGVLWQWGEITSYAPVPNPLPAGITQIAVGEIHMVVRTTNGTLIGWGSSGPISFPPGLTNVSTICAGQFATFAAITGPMLRSQPSGASVMSGTNYTFTVSADSASPFQYQWYHDNSPLPQGTNATLRLNSVHTNAAGYYFVTASNTYGSVTSSIASLTVTAMNVLFVPQPQSVLTLQPATFGITVESLLPLQFQWYHNGDPIPYGTNATLTITNAHNADQGLYSVCVANDDQTVCPSTHATLTVYPIWTVADASVVKIPGSTNSLRFTVTMPEPAPFGAEIIYQTFNGTGQPGIDYLDVSGTSFFAPAETNLFIDVPIIGNTNIGPKTFRLYARSSYVLFSSYFSSTGQGLILDPNYVPTISMAANASIREGDDTNVVQQEIQISGPASQPITVNFSTADDSAHAGIDYVATNGQIMFPPPTTSQQLSLTILGNILKQTNRTFTVNFSQPVNGALTNNQIVETIQDDDTITLPQGFQTTFVATNFHYPSVLEFAPDGRLFVGEQQGDVWVIKDGVRLPEPFLHANTATAPSEGSEAGLLGIAFDPAFATNHFIYVYYTSPTPYLHNRVSRFTADGDQAVPGSEHILLELNRLTFADNHNAGSIHFGPDGKLYVAVGDNLFGVNSQSLTNLLGKILRINPDGSIPTDNPFYATATNDNRAIWAMGLRNPFSFAFQPGTGRMLINDVGENTWEEINQGSAGANYGWPVAEGPTNLTGFQNPIFAYTHTNGCAIVGSTFYNPDTLQFPDDYRGNYFFADYCGGWIHRLIPGNQVVDFIGGIKTPIALQAGPDGALYCLCANSGNGTVYKFTYSRSSRVEWARPLPDGRLQLRVSGTPNLPYILQGSTNLLFWEPLLTNSLPSTQWDFYDTPGNLPLRFYRLAQ